jgi:hypothetical protein
VIFAPWARGHEVAYGELTGVPMLHGSAKIAKVLGTMRITRLIWANALFGVKKTKSESHVKQFEQLPSVYHTNVVHSGVCCRRNAEFLMVQPVFRDPNALFQRQVSR